MLRRVPERKWLKTPFYVDNLLVSIQHHYGEGIENKEGMEPYYAFCWENHQEVLFRFEHQAEGLGEDGGANSFFWGENSIVGFIEYHEL